MYTFSIILYIIRKGTPAKKVCREIRYIFCIPFKPKGNFNIRVLNEVFILNFRPFDRNYIKNTSFENSFDMGFFAFEKFY